MAEASNKWDRLNGESDKAFAAFCVYRDLGAERSAEKVQLKLSKSTGYLRQLYKWSSLHNWVDRVSAWDDFKDKEVQAALIVNEQTVINNELSDYEFWRKVVDKRKKIIDDANYKGEGFEMFNLLELMTKSHNLGRRALKMPEKYTESKQDITSGGKELKALTASDLSDDDLANIAAGRGGGAP